ncbi:MAG: efflux RND transporter permease subunit [Burkholderiaceae bacterium]|jgi:HAE1 family hydrophobic/amphiphilic exporter-1|nr:efflux RND transporter permease subunit [Burkholderiaceae bacterium]
MWFTQISLKNPVLATMMMLVLVVLGGFSLQRLQVDQFPNVEYPYVVVVTRYPGASPAIVESEVTRKIEEAVNSVAGIREMTSHSYEGMSQVVVLFQTGVDVRRAASDVREKVAQVRPSLREEVKDPWVQRFDPNSQPIWWVAATPSATAQQGGQALSATEVTDWADQVLKKRLENVRGVGGVDLVGATQREIHIDLIPEQLEAYGVSPGQVLAAVQNENQSLPLGDVRAPNQELVVQIKGRMARPEDFGRIIVAQRGGADGVGPVYLDQVAQVKDSAQEPVSLALYNDQRTVLLGVHKSQDENTIDVVDGLNKVIRTIGPEVPPGLQLTVVSDNSRPIRVAVSNVRQTLIEGALLTVLIVFLFLNSWRSTVITGLTLPVSIIGTFFFMQLMGFSINLMTLMALSLCVGFLIDDAIVVRENIVRHLQMGKRPYEAALEGTREIGLAVLATTFSIVAVFLSVGFMQGILGQFFRPFGLTIVAAVLISMFVSFTLDPMLSSIWRDPAIHAPNQHGGTGSRYDRTFGRVTGAFGRATERFGQFYQRVLCWALGHRLATVIVAAAIFIGSALMLPLLGSDFVPSADFSQINLSFYTPPGTSLQATEAKVRQVSGIIRSYPEVRYLIATINSVATGKNNAGVYIRLVDRNRRRLGADEFSAELRRRLLTVPGITVTQAGLVAPVSGSKAISLSLEGPDQMELERIAGPLLERFRRIPGLVDLDTSMRPDNPAIDVTLDRDAASSLGLSLAQVAAPLRTLIAGQTAGNWRAPNGQTYDVVVRLTPEARNSPQALEHLPLAVVGPDGQPHIVRLNQVATLSQGGQTNQIHRRTMLRQIWFNADTYGRSTGEVAGDMQAIMNQTPLPPGYHYEFIGTTQDMQEAFVYGKRALLMAVIFIYMILASQFRSFVQPLALMTSLPLTLIGVVLALLAFGTTLSMFSIIGIVTLMGLVTKNAILLVDFANRARVGHIDKVSGVALPPLPRDEALLAAARVRLRPILMTTLAMIFGMLPLAFATSEGAEQRAPLGQAVIGGVITSSLLTLVVVPVVYSYLDDLAGWFKRWIGSRQNEADY